MDIKRIEELKHHEELLFKTLTYLSKMLVNIMGYEEEMKVYEEIGFTKDDLNYFRIRDYDIEFELGLINEEEYKKGVMYEN